MEALRLIAPQSVLVDWGPMTLTVSCWLKGRARPVMAAKAGASCLGLLAALADFQGYMRLPVSRLPQRGRLPRVVARAAGAVRRVAAVSGVDLTPLAAVAGAVADSAAEAAAALGADRVLVNNGGDIALYLAPGQSAAVGLTSQPGGPVAHRLTVRGGDGVGGVATSGWQGRSFSPGVADQVGVWAQSAALADAAATALAGLVTLDSPAVERRPARDLDPASDLGATPVTVKVGRLSPSEIQAALDQGQAAAQKLISALPIGGAHLLLAGQRRLVQRLQQTAPILQDLPPGRLAGAAQAAII